MNLRGKTCEQIEHALVSRSRAELVSFIFKLVTVEQQHVTVVVSDKVAFLLSLRHNFFGALQ